MFLWLLLALTAVLAAAGPPLLTKLGNMFLPKLPVPFVKIGGIWFGHLLELKVFNVSLSGQWLSRFPIPLDLELVRVAEVHLRWNLFGQSKAVPMFGLEVTVSGVTVQGNVDRVAELGPTAEELEELVRGRLLSLLDSEQDSWFAREDPQPQTGFNLVPLLPLIAKFGHLLAVQVLRLRVRALQPSKRVAADVALPALRINPAEQAWREELRPKKASTDCAPDKYGDLVVQIDGLQVALHTEFDAAVLASATEQPDLLEQELQAVFNRADNGEGHCFGDHLLVEPLSLYVSVRALKEAAKAGDLGAQLVAEIGIRRVGAVLSKPQYAALMELIAKVLDNMAQTEATATRLASTLFREGTAAEEQEYCDIYRLTLGDPELGPGQPTPEQEARLAELHKQLLPVQLAELRFRCFRQLKEKLGAETQVAARPRTDGLVPKIMGLLPLVGLGAGAVFGLFFWWMGWWMLALPSFGGAGFAAYVQFVKKPAEAAAAAVTDATPAAVVQDVQQQPPVEVEPQAAPVATTQEEAKKDEESAPAAVETSPAPEETPAVPSAVPVVAPVDQEEEQGLAPPAVPSFSSNSVAAPLAVPTVEEPQVPAAAAVSTSEPQVDVTAVAASEQSLLQKDAEKPAAVEEVLGPVGLFGLRIHASIAILEVEARLEPLIEAHVCGLQIAAVHDPQVTGTKGQRFGAQLELEAVAVTDVSLDPAGASEPVLPELRHLVYIAGSGVRPELDERHAILAHSVEGPPAAFAEPGIPAALQLDADFLQAAPFTSEKPRLPEGADESLARGHLKARVAVGGVAVSYGAVLMRIPDFFNLPADAATELPQAEEVEAGAENMFQELTDLEELHLMGLDQDYPAKDAAAAEVELQELGGMGVLAEVLVGRVLAQVPLAPTEAYSPALRLWTKLQAHASMEELGKPAVTASAGVETMIQRVRIRSASWQALSPKASGGAPVPAPAIIGGGGKVVAAAGAGRSFRTHTEQYMLSTQTVEQTPAGPKISHQPLEVSLSAQTRDSPLLPEEMAIDADLQVGSGTFAVTYQDYSLIMGMLQVLVKDLELLSPAPTPEASVEQLVAEALADTTSRAQAVEKAQPAVAEVAVAAPPKPTHTRDLSQVPQAVNVSPEVTSRRLELPPAAVVPSPVARPLPSDSQSPSVPDLHLLPGSPAPRAVEPSPEQGTRTLSLRPIGLSSHSVPQELTAPLPELESKESDEAPAAPVKQQQQQQQLRKLQVEPAAADEAEADQQEEEAAGPPASFGHMTVCVRVGKLTVQIINDCLFTAVPIARIVVSETQARLTAFSNERVIKSSVSVSAHFWNNHLVAWEPLLEPWEVRAMVQQTQCWVSSFRVSPAGSEPGSPVNGQVSPSSGGSSSPRAGGADSVAKRLFGRCRAELLEEPEILTNLNVLSPAPVLNINLTQSMFRGVMAALDLLALSQTAQAALPEELAGNFRVQNDTELDLFFHPVDPVELRRQRMAGSQPAGKQGAAAAAAGDKQLTKAAADLETEACPVPGYCSRGFDFPSADEHTHQVVVYFDEELGWEPLRLSLTRVQSTKFRRNLRFLRFDKLGAPVDPSQIPVVAAAKAEERQNANQCGHCNTKFSLLVKRHHCRNCGISCCIKCSDQGTLDIGDKRKQRACNPCFKRFTDMVREGLVEVEIVADVVIIKGQKVLRLRSPLELANRSEWPVRVEVPAPDPQSDFMLPARLAAPGLRAAELRAQATRMRTLSRSVLRPGDSLFLPLLASAAHGADPAVQASMPVIVTPLSVPGSPATQQLEHARSPSSGIGAVPEAQGADTIFLPTAPIPLQHPSKGMRPVSRLTSVGRNHRSVHVLLLTHSAQTQAGRKLATVFALRTPVQVDNLLSCSANVRLMMAADAGKAPAAPGSASPAGKQLFVASQATVRRGEVWQVSDADPLQPLYLSVELPSLGCVWSKVLRLGKAAEAAASASVASSSSSAAAGDGDGEDEPEPGTGSSVTTLTLACEAPAGPGGAAHGNLLHLSVELSFHHGCMRLVLFAPYWIHDFTSELGLQFSHNRKLLVPHPRPLDAEQADRVAEAYRREAERQGQQLGVGADSVTGGLLTSEAWQPDPRRPEDWRRAVMFSFPRAGDKSNKLFVRSLLSDWSEGFGIEAVGLSGELTMVQSATPTGLRKRFTLGVKVDAGPGLFRRTKIISITPRFVICNSLPTGIALRQFGVEKPAAAAGGAAPSSPAADPTLFQLPALDKAVFHPFVDAGHATEKTFGIPLALSFRRVVDNSQPQQQQHLVRQLSEWDWSGFFDVNQVGDLSLHVRNHHNGGSWYASISVRLEGPTIFMMIGELRGANDSAAQVSVAEKYLLPYRIENRLSHQLVRFRQSKSEKDIKLSATQSESPWTLVEQETAIRYAWEEPLMTRSLDLEIGLVSETAAAGRPQKTHGQLRAAVWFEFESEADGSTPVDDNQEGTLHVWLESAQSLPAMDATGTSDGFVKLSLQPDPSRRQLAVSRVIQKNLNPVWRERFSFSVEPSRLRSRRLKLSVFDKDLLRSEAIGDVIVALADVPQIGNPVPDAVVRGGRRRSSASPQTRRQRSRSRSRSRSRNRLAADAKTTTAEDPKRFAELAERFVQSFPILAAKDAHDGQGKFEERLSLEADLLMDKPKTLRVTLPPSVDANAWQAQVAVISAGAGGRKRQKAGAKLLTGIGKLGRAITFKRDADRKQNVYVSVRNDGPTKVIVLSDLPNMLVDFETESVLKAPVPDPAAFPGEAMMAGDLAGTSPRSVASAPGGGVGDAQQPPATPASAGLPPAFPFSSPSSSSSSVASAPPAAVAASPSSAVATAGQHQRQPSSPPPAAMRPTPSTEDLPSLARSPSRSLLGGFSRSRRSSVPANARRLGFTVLRGSLLPRGQELSVQVSVVGASGSGSQASTAGLKTPADLGELNWNEELAELVLPADKSDDATQIEIRVMAAPKGGPMGFGKLVSKKKLIAVTSLPVRDWLQAEAGEPRWYSLPAAPGKDGKSAAAAGHPGCRLELSVAYQGPEGAAAATSAAEPSQTGTAESKAEDAESESGSSGGEENYDEPLRLDGGPEELPLRRFVLDLKEIYGLQRLAEARKVNWRAGRVVALVECPAAAYRTGVIVSADGALEIGPGARQPYELELLVPAHLLPSEQEVEAQLAERAQRRVRRRQQLEFLENLRTSGADPGAFQQHAAEFAAEDARDEAAWQARQATHEQAMLRRGAFVDVRLVYLPPLPKLPAWEQGERAAGSQLRFRAPDAKDDKPQQQQEEEERKQPVAAAVDEEDDELAPLAVLPEATAQKVTELARVRLPLDQVVASPKSLSEDRREAENRQLLINQGLVDVRRYQLELQRKYLGLEPELRWFDGNWFQLEPLDAPAGFHLLGEANAEEVMPVAESTEPPVLLEDDRKEKPAGGKSGKDSKAAAAAAAAPPAAAVPAAPPAATRVHLSLRRYVERAWEERPTLKLNAQIPRVGVSLIDGKPRELLYLSLSDIRLKVEDAPRQQTLAFSLARMQIDNQTPNCAFPIVLAPTAVPAADLQPMLQTSVIMRKDPSSPVMSFDGVSVLLQKLDVMAEEDLIYDILGFVSEFSVDGSAARRNPDELTALAYASQSRQLALPASMSESQAPLYLYFKQLELQPIALNLSFLSSPHNRAGGLSLAPTGFIVNLLVTALNTVGAIAGSIDAAPLRLDGHVINHMNGTADTLVSSLVRHYVGQGLKELYKILGSLEFLGNPVGLVSNLSDGVMAFFFEPAKGLVSSPEDFGRGLAKGTGQLVGNLTSGVFGAASKITGSIGKGVAVLSMDKDYIVSRQHRGKKPEHLGAGLAQGGKSLATGVFRGVTGVFLDPIRGAQREGVKGFAKGIGTGLVGVVTKSAAGAIDMVSDTLTGAGNTAGFLMNDVKPNTRARAPRVFAADGRLTGYDAAEAEAAEKARKK